MGNNFRRGVLHKIVVLQHIVTLMWPASVYAAQFAFTTKEAGEFIPSILATLALSTMSGLTLILTDMIEEYVNKPTIERLWLFIASRLSGSLTMGMLAFAMATKVDLDFASTSISIIIAGFGGTTLLKKVVVKYVDKLTADKKD